MHHLRATIKAINPSIKLLIPTSRFTARIQRGRNSMRKHLISRTNTAQATDYPTMLTLGQILMPRQLKRLFTLTQLILFHHLTSQPVL
jgi:hypothetical protein